MGKIKLKNMGTFPKTIAIDFDGVIHAYSYGWQDGDIYDEPLKDAIKSINKLMADGYSVFIFSTRSSRQIKNWIRKYSNLLMYMSQSDFQDQFYPMCEWDNDFITTEESEDKLQYKVKVIPFWKKFWNSNKFIGITKRKLPAHAYIDDRAITFKGDWTETLADISYFKTYQGK